MTNCSGTLKVHHVLVRAVIVVLACTASVAADSVPPWVVGVTEAQKSTAQERLAAGNELFLENKYADALAAYEVAIGAWDHPAIRFNIVRCLIQLDRPVEAFDNLVLALKYGAAPLEEAVFREARSYEKLLANQIGELDVACAQPGVAVTLDGRPLMTCPATRRVRVVPGPHQLVGVKQGFATRSFEVVVVGGTQQRADLELEPIARTARVSHRWGIWMPWTVVGAGLALTGFGALIEARASASFAEFDKMIQRDCADGCVGVDFSARDNARRENRIGIGVLAGGAATVVVGGVLLYLNRARTTYPVEVDVRVTQQGGVVSMSRSF